MMVGLKVASLDPMRVELLDVNLGNHSVEKMVHYLVVGMVDWMVGMMDGKMGLGLVLT